jgi:eukaryotic-like serine/threonine-protein kinase
VKARGLSLGVKIFFGTALVVVVVLGVTLAVTARSATRAADESVNRVLGAAREAALAHLTGRADALLKAAEVFAGNSEFRAIVRGRSLADNLDQAIVAVEQIGADWVQIVDADGLRLAKSDDPQAEMISLAGSPAIGAALEDRPVTAFGVSGDTMLAQIAVAPVADDRRVFGALMAARALDAVLASEVKQQAATDLEVVFYLLDEDDVPIVAGSTIRGRSELTELLATSARMAAEDTALGVTSEVELDGEHYVGLGGVLRSAGGAPLGGFMILRNRDAEFAVFNQLQRTILLSGAIGIVFAGLLSLLVARWVTRPVGKLVEATRRATDGDYDANITATSNDEIGVLARAFRGMLADLREKQQLVEFLSASDQARTVQLRTLSATSEQRLAEGGLKPGQTFAGRYEVKDLLGAGGMGMVFKAVDRELGETIAIKTLKQEYLAQDPTALDRFKSEIRLARRISHRNVVRTHDIGEQGGVYYITMEYVDGTSLKDLIRQRGRLPLPVTLSVGKQLARALEVAHDQGIVHRDIKPANMVVEPDGVLKVMDFGIARLAVRPGQQGVTQAGMIIGTPECMAPEQVTGEEVDQRADIYAAGCVLYECLTGRPPITAENSFQMVAKLLEETPASPRSLDPAVPAALDALVMRMLSKDPAGRPQSAPEVHDALARIG